ncbi:MAG: sigma-70 family RNA polymerase sigma factor [Fimbriiglobus sp.]
MTGIPAFLRRWQRLSTGQSDADCLARYCESRDAEAFAQIMGRYSGLVWAVCRRQLRRPADIEDAYQTTFLALATKPHSVRNAAVLSAWLHGTAWRVSQKIRKTRSTEALTDAPERQSDLPETLQALDEELLQLPEKYRLPLVHCYLREQTQDEAALELGLSLSTLKRRLEVGRERLRVRLQRRGIELGSLLALGASSGSATTTATTILTLTTAIPIHLKPLLHGVFWTMFLEKIRMSILVVGLSGVTITGVGLGLVSITAQSPGSGPGSGTKPPATKPADAPTPAKPVDAKMPELTESQRDEIERLDHEIKLADLRIKVAKVTIEDIVHLESASNKGLDVLITNRKAQVSKLKAEEEILIQQRAKDLAERQKQKLLSTPSLKLAADPVLKPAVKPEMDPELRKLLEGRVQAWEEIIANERKRRKEGGFQNSSEVLLFYHVQREYLNAKLALLPSQNEEIRIRKDILTACRDAHRYIKVRFEQGIEQKRSVDLAEAETLTHEIELYRLTKSAK